MRLVDPMRAIIVILSAIGGAVFGGLIVALVVTRISANSIATTQDSEELSNMKFTVQFVKVGACSGVAGGLVIGMLSAALANSRLPLARGDA